MNEKRMIDRPNRTGSAPSSRRTMYLSTGRDHPLNAYDPRSRSAPGVAPPVALHTRGVSTDRLLVEPDRVEELGQVARADEALDVGLRSGDRLRIHEWHSWHVRGD